VLFVWKGEETYYIYRETILCNFNHFFFCDVFNLEKKLMYVTEIDHEYFNFSKRETIELKI